MQGPFVFVDVDTQRDFLEPAGALPVPDAPSILPRLTQLTTHARRRGIPVIATACAHRPSDEEFEVFPPHCLVGSRGQERVEATAWPGGMVLHADDRLPADLAAPPAHLTIQKRVYDVSAHPDMERVIALHAQGDPLFVVYGVATDYCVRAAVEGLLARGRRVAIVVDAVRAVDPGNEPALLTEFARCGVLLTVADAVCGVA